MRTLQEAQRLMFLFFSNRLGCAGSLLTSLAITVLLLFLLGWINF